MTESEKPTGKRSGGRRRRSKAAPRRRGSSAATEAAAAEETAAAAPPATETATDGEAKASGPATESDAAEPAEATKATAEAAAETQAAPEAAKAEAPEAAKAEAPEAASEEAKAEAEAPAPESPAVPPPPAALAGEWIGAGRIGFRFALGDGGASVEAFDVRRRGAYTVEDVEWDGSELRWTVIIPANGMRLHHTVTPGDGDRMDGAWRNAARSDAELPLALRGRGLALSGREQLRRR